MIIRFIGHMCHYTTSKKAYAIMFDVPQHFVELRVREGDTGLQPGDDEYTGDPDFIHCWGTSKSIVSFSSSGTSATAFDLTALVPVPALSLLGGAGLNLHPDVVTPNPTGNFNVFVEVPFGDYGIEDWYEYKATFNVGKTYICVPRTITITAPSTDIWVISGVPGAPTLTPDAVITMTNIETQSVPGTHYQYHGTLFDPSIVPARPIPSTTLKCSDGTKDPYIPICPDHGEQDLSVECSNTRYP